MTAADPVARALQRLPNVGPRIAADLVRLGVRGPDDLAHRDPDAMYAALCERDGVRHDICVRDVFAAVVAHARGEPSRPWWAFSRERKARDRQGATPL